MTLKPWEDLQRSFNLRDEERPLVERYSSSVPQEWRDLFHQTATLALPNDWLGLFQDSQAADPFLVIQASEAFRPALGSGEHDLVIPAGYSRFSIGASSRNLIPAPLVPVAESVTHAGIRRLRIVSIPQKTSKVARRCHYLAARRCHYLLLYPRSSLSLPFGVKWRGLVHRNFELNWRFYLEPNAAAQRRGVLMECVSPGGSGE